MDKLSPSLANAKHLQFCAALKRGREVLRAQNEVLSPVARTISSVHNESDEHSIFFAYISLFGAGFLLFFVMPWWADSSPQHLVCSQGCFVPLWESYPWTCAFPQDCQAFLSRIECCSWSRQARPHTCGIQQLNCERRFDCQDFWLFGTKNGCILFAIFKVIPLTNFLFCCIMNTIVCLGGNHHERYDSMGDCWPRNHC